MSSKGPIYGVDLIESMPCSDAPNGMRQAMPCEDDLKTVMDKCAWAGRGGRTVAAYEVLLSHYREAVDALQHLHDFCCHEPTHGCKQGFQDALTKAHKVLAVFNAIQPKQEPS